MKKIIIGLLTAGSTILFTWFLFTNVILTSEVANNERKNLRDESEIFVYETDADSADQCSSYEQYDEENAVCYFECENEKECEKINEEIEKELGNWAQDLAEDKKDVEEKSIPENDKSLQANYKVKSGEKIVFENGNDDEKFRNIWQEIAELSPDNLSNNYVEEYQIFDNKNDDTLAFVDDEDGNGKWRIAVNLAGYNTSTERENKSTFIHELGHIISLNSSQVNSQISKDECKTFYLDEGCTLSNSYLNNFKNKFWLNISSQEFAEDKFLTEYAASNEVEDLAESFAFFVLEKDLDKLGTLEKDEKMKYFYNYSELVQIRKDMRNVLSKNIVRAKKLQNE